MKNIINQINKDNSDFFLGPIFKTYAENICSMILRRFKKKLIKVTIVNGKGIDIAKTDNQVIIIDLMHFVLDQTEIKVNKFRLIRGLLGHELGHVIFDDFVIYNKIISYWENKKIVFPLCDYQHKLSEVQVENYKSLQEYVSKSYEGKLLLNLYLKFDNILSDSYVNKQVYEEIPELKNDLKFLLSEFRREYINSFEEVDSINSILNTLLFYSVYRIINNEESKRELMIKIFKIAPLIMKIKDTRNGKLRSFYIQVIFLEFWDDIKDYIDKHLENGDQDEQSFGLIISRPLMNTPGYESYDDVCNTTTLPLLSIEELYNIEKVIQSGLVETPKGLKEKYDLTDACYINEFITELVKIKNMGENSIIELDVSISTDEEISLNRLEKLIDKEKDALEYQAQEKLHSDELVDFDRNIDYHNIHTGLTVEILRGNYIKDCQMPVYDEFLKNNVYPISRRLVDSLELPNRSLETKIKNGYYSGKRIHFPSIVKKELKIFERYNYYEKPSSVSFMTVIDISASTEQQQRLDYEKIATLVLLDAAKVLNFKVGVLAHRADTKSADVELNILSDFNEDSNDFYRILELKSNNRNRDGYAITYACERLMTQSTDVKICIVMTDGLPNASKNNYQGRIAENDLKYVVDKYKKQGIILIVAAIGEDKQKIKEIYGDCFLDITDPDKLPEVFCKIIMKYYR